MNIPNVRGHKVYNNADSKDVENYILYIGEPTYVEGQYDNEAYYAYLDPEFTKPVNADEMLRMFLQGCIICWTYDNGAWLMKPENCGIFAHFDNTEYVAMITSDRYPGEEPLAYQVVSSEYHVVSR